MTATTTAPTERAATRKNWLDVWHVTPSVNRDYDFIDGLRGVAILMVVISHHFYVNPNSGLLTRYVGAIIGSGTYGVILFYALSGFLISWPFWKRKAVGSEKTVPQGYAQRRFWKIYPPLAFSIVILTPFYIITRADPSYLSTGLKWLAGWPFVIPVNGKFNPVMWTLVMEVQFYATLPLLFYCLKRVSPKMTLAIITTLFLVVPVLVRGLTNKAPSFSPTIDAHYPSGLDSFCLGILIAGLENLGFIKKSWVRWGVAGIVLWPLALLAASLVDMHPQEKSFVATEMVQGGVKFAAACLLLFIAQPQHGAAKLLCFPGLRWFGIISYEWYLFHQPLAIWARTRFGPANGDLLRFTLIVSLPVLVSLIGSAAIYRFFSLPLLRYGRGKNQR